MDSMTWIGIFALAGIILGGVAATLFAKRNDELLHRKGPQDRH